MPGNFKKEDLRIKKTHAALINALLTLLSRRNFNQVTVNDLCEEALISRAAFYIHFKDKYDLLKYWLSNVENGIIKSIYNCKKLEITVNQFIHENQKIITNIFKDMNTETLSLIENFISSLINISIKRNVINKTSSNYIILSNFCTGGLVSLLSLQVKEKFALDVNMMSSYLYRLLTYIMEWDEKQEQKEINIGDLNI